MARLAVRLLALLLQLPISLPLVRAHCSVPMKGTFHGWSPVMMSRSLSLIYSKLDDPQLLTFDWFEDRLLYCPGGHLKFRNADLPMVEAQPLSLPPVVRCVQEQTFVLQRGNLPAMTLGELECSTVPEVEAWYDDLRCLHDGRLVNLGFPIYPEVPLRHVNIKLCYKEATATTSWARHIVQPSIAGRSTLDDYSNGFKKAQQFDGIPITSKVYGSCAQTQTFKQLFRHLVFKDQYGNPIDERTLLPGDLSRLNDELNALVSRFIRTGPTDKNFFAIGHLAPRADFFYPIEQSSTFFYANAVPMWMSINNGNWGAMEDWVRALAEEKGSELEVWTGGVGVLRLLDVDIYLARRRHDGAYVVPAPKILFKIVHCPKLNQAIVFLAANNPYIANDREALDYMICSEYRRCRELKPKLGNYDKGLVYCCLYHDWVTTQFAHDVVVPVNMPADVEPLV